MITTVLLLYTGGQLTALIYRGEKRPMQGVFWLFAYITMGVAPLAQVATGLHQRLAESGQMIWAYGLVFVGLLSYDVGTAIAKRRDATVAAAMHFEAAKVSRSELNIGRLTIVSFATLAITGFNILQRGLTSYFTSRQESASVFADVVGESDGQATRALLSALDAVPQLIVLLAWILVFHQQRAAVGRSTFSTKLWILLFIGANAVVNNPITNSRFWALTVAVSILFVIPWVRPAMYRTTLIGGAAAAVLVFPLSDVFRLSSQYRAQYGFESRGIVENLAVKDYDQMIMIANGLWYVDDQGFHFGEQMLGNVLFWVPRSLWPTKPVDTGVDIGTAMGAVNVNLSSPLWIELFVDFGVLGVILGFALVGYWSRRGDTAFMRQTMALPGGATAVSIIVPIIAGYQFILLRGPLLQSMGRLVTMTLIVLFVFSRVRAGTDARASAPERQVLRR